MRGVVAGEMPAALLTDFEEATVSFCVGSLVQVEVGSVL
jgi:hypothetical protein